MKANLNLLLVGLLVVWGCGPSRETGVAPPSPDQVFGRYIEGKDPQGRLTVHIVPPEGDHYFVYPIPIDSLIARYRPFPVQPIYTGSATDVEVVFMGAFPDPCYQVHSVQEQRSGNLIALQVLARRNQGALCTAVMVPYRFYYTLSEELPAGAYTLLVNGRAFPLQVRYPNIQEKAS